MITPWIFEFFHELRDPAARADPAAVHRHFRWYQDLWAAAEERGYEGIFFSEHHFGSAYSPAPNLLLPAVAARTSRLRLGVLGSVSAYATPWRLVEEMGMLDHLLDGRLELGVVRGIPPEQALVGITPDVAAEMHDEALAVIGAALAAGGGRVSHHGKHWRFDDLRLVPPALQQPHPPLWTAVRTPASAERAGSLGWKVCAGFSAAEEIAGWFDGYRRAAAAAGHPAGPEQLALRRFVTLVDRPEDRADGHRAGRRALKELLEASAGDLPPFALALDAPDQEDGPLSRQEFISGTPEQVAEEIIGQCRTIGAGHFLACFSPTERDELDRTHQRVAREVIPQLRAARLS